MANFIDKAKSMKSSATFLGGSLRFDNQFLQSELATTEYDTE